MKLKNVLIALGVVVVLVLGVYFPQKNPIIQQIVGGQSGPEDTNPYHSIGGVERWYYSSALNNASSTVCVFKSPTATSTLTFASMTITTATTSQLAVDIAKGNGSAATTTMLASMYTVAGSAKATIVASTTPAAENADLIFGPNKYLVYKISGPSAFTGTASISTIKGACKAEFIVN